MRFTADYSVALEKVLKGRSDEIDEREEVYKRDMPKEYKRVVDTVTKYEGKAEFD